MMLLPLRVLALLPLGIFYLWTSLPEGKNASYCSLQLLFFFEVSSLRVFFQPPAFAVNRFTMVVLAFRSFHSS